MTSSGVPEAHPPPATAAVVERWLRGWIVAVAERREWLTDLDAAIGDGDHGINLHRGLTRFGADLDAGLVGVDDAGALLTAAGRTLMGVVGGASGALYGRALSHAGSAVGSDTLLDRLPEVALEAAVDAITALGKASPGDKTMLDALVPALDALRAAPGVPVAERAWLAAEAADAGARATIPLVARKGRASYLGERSAGHLDPGAASSALLVRCLADAIARP